MIELVRTVEIGPFVVPGDPRVMFVVEIYKDLEKTKRFLPIVLRRAGFRVTSSFAKKHATKQLHIIEPAFVPDAFTRTSAEAVLKAVVRKICADFAPG